jgi:hypothetical protein
LTIVVKRQHGLEVWGVMGLDQFQLHGLKVQ